MRMRSLSFLLMGIACWVVCAGLTPAQEKDEKKVRQVIDEATKALLKKDLDGFLKVTDVPYYHDGVAVLGTRDVLKKTIQKMFQEREVDLSKAPFSIKKILPYKEGRKFFTTKKFQDMMERVMKADDWMVWVEIHLPNRLEPEGGVFFVARREGQMKIVGLQD